MGLDQYATARKGESSVDDEGFGSNCVAGILDGTGAESGEVLRVWGFVWAQEPSPDGFEASNGLGQQQG